MRYARLAVVLLMVAGCGGGGSPKARSTPTAAAEPSSSSPAASLPPVTRAQALEVAKAINVIAGDLPGFRGEPLGGGVADRDASLFRCFGTDDPTDLVQVESDVFRKGVVGRALTVFSDVDVAATEADATAKLDGYRSDNAPDCMASLYDSSLRARLAKDGIELSRVSGSPGTTAAATPDAFALVLTAVLTYRGNASQMRVEIDGFRVRRTTVLFTTIGAGDLFPDEQRRARVAELLARAETKAV